MLHGTEAGREEQSEEMRLLPLYVRGQLGLYRAYSSDRAELEGRVSRTWVMRVVRDSKTQTEGVTAQSTLILNLPSSRWA